MNALALRVTTGLFAGSLLAGSALLLPAQAATPVFTGGLVNVTVTDVANNVTVSPNIGVGAALALAANVCDVPVTLLSQQLSTGSATCTNTVTGTMATITQATRR